MVKTSMAKSVRLSEKTVPQVLELAAQLYAERNQLSLDDVQQAGLELQIPSEYVEQAVQQLQVQTYHRQRIKQVIIAGVIASSTLVGFSLTWTRGQIAAWDQRATATAQIRDGVASRGFLGLRNGEYIQKTACHNLAVQEYNQRLQTLPGSAVAALFNLDAKALVPGTATSDWSELAQTIEQDGSLQAYNRLCR